MDKFLIKKPKETQPLEKRSRVEINLAELVSDPGERKQISEFHPTMHNEIRREYYLRGPYRPSDPKYEFPQTKIGAKMRRFNTEWFSEFNDWLEYSVTKDAAFCLYCYLFSSSGTEKAFVSIGFRNWKDKKRLNSHVGGPDSAHNHARIKCESLTNENRHIRPMLDKQTDQTRKSYRVHLNSTVIAVRYLLRQGLAFRGHDETEDSCNKGNFLELLKTFSDISEDIKNVMKNAPENAKLVSPKIQKDIVSAAGSETTSAIIAELGSSFFSILIDESRDSSIKEQMAIVLRFVDKNGRLVERFLAIVHVRETNAKSLKEAIERTLSKHDLSIAKIRGQGYDGASNMRGEFNGLKTLILKDNETAYYIHCFAHQLQLALVAVARNHGQVDLFFHVVSSLSNVIGVSCKRLDILRERQSGKIAEALEMGEIESGRGLHQETTLKRPGDTRWGSHYGALINLSLMFGSIVDVLEIIEETSNSGKKGEAIILLDNLQDFEFVFCLHLMRNILGLTNDLSVALQRKDQDIINALDLVAVAKQSLQEMREEGWDSILEQTTQFCTKHDIMVPIMSEFYRPRGRSRRRVEKFSNVHHYRVEIFHTVIDMQLQELNNRFTEGSTELLMCVSCLSPTHTFSQFDKTRLLQMAKFYPKEFSDFDLIVLESQLETYVRDVRSNPEFGDLKSLTELAEKMVQKKKILTFPLVFLLITLALVLPVATATVERVFSAMNVVKNRLRNRMGDEWVNDALVTYIEREIFDTISDEVIMKKFQSMKPRRITL